MAYPTSPVDGQIYGNKKYNSTRNAWENCFIPQIGTIYTQLPGKTAPADIYGGTWKDISETYAGAFFRTAGGNASTFESYLTVSTATTTIITFTTTHGLSIGSLLKSSSGEVRIVSIINSTTQITVSTAFSTVPTGSMLIGQSSTVLSNQVAYGHDNVVSNGELLLTLSSSGIYYSNNNYTFSPSLYSIRPANFTVKIWERTA